MINLIYDALHSIEKVEKTNEISILEKNLHSLLDVIHIDHIGMYSTISRSCITIPIPNTDIGYRIRVLEKSNKLNLAIFKFLKNKELLTQEVENFLLRENIKINHSAHKKDEIIFIEIVNENYRLDFEIHKKDFDSFNAIMQNIIDTECQ